MYATLDLTFIHQFFESENHMAANKSFYDLYVKRWGDDQTQLSWEHFQDEELQQLKQMVTWIENNFDRFVQNFYEQSKLAPKPITFMPFIGNYFSSGWAEYDDGRAVVYFGIECYADKQQMEVFFYHEFAHGYHLEIMPDFRIVNDHDFYAISRNIIYEGVATFTTKKVLNSDDLLALWGNNTESFYVDWYDACLASKLDMYQRLVADLHKQDQATFFHWFGMEDNTLGREGYFVGLQFIKQFYHEVVSLQQIMEIPLAEAGKQLDRHLSRANTQ